MTAETCLRLVPETAEVVVCGDTEIHGGQYEFVCVLEPHGEKVAHYRKAFKAA